MAKKSKKKDGKKAERKAAGRTPSQPDPRAAVLADKRRTKLRTAHEAAQATVELTGLDEELELTNAELRTLEAQRVGAEQHLIELHSAIGTAQLTRARVRSRRKQARAHVSATRERAVTAERHYDNAVLAQLLDADLDREGQPAH